MMDGISESVKNSPRHSEQLFLAEERASGSVSKLNQPQENNLRFVSSFPFCYILCEIHIGNLINNFHYSNVFFSIVSLKGPQFCITFP